MSMADVKPYARARMVALGFVEWTNGFIWDDIPDTLLNSRFHLELGQSRNQKVSQDNVEIIVPLKVRTFHASTSNPKGLIDSAAARVDSITTAFIKASTALVQTSSIRCVSFVGSRVLPLARTNDNGVIVETDFNFLTIASTL